MARDGSGNYSLPAGNPVVTATTISSTTHNSTMSDVATALTNSLAKNGETTPTANLPMGTYRHTNVGDASARNHYGVVGQIQDGDYSVCSSVAGTNTITASLTPAITSYSAGMPIVLTPANNNTGAATLAINGLTALDVLKNDGDALVSGDLVQNVPAVLVLDSGSDDWFLLNPQANTVNNANWSGTDLAVANGGTGGSDASTARTNLGVAIGSDVQAFDQNLADVAGLATTNGGFIVGDGSNFVLESGATARTSLGLGSLATASSVNNSDWSGTDLAVANGGTGSSTAGGAATNLGLGTGDSPTFTGLTLSGSSFDPGSASVTTDNDTADEVGFKGSPINTQNGNYTLLLTDAARTIHKASGGSGETITIPANASVAFPVGTLIGISNSGGGTLSIAITSDTLVNTSDGATGTRTLADDGLAVIQKVASTTWKIAGNGLS